MRGARDPQRDGGRARARTPAPRRAAARRHRLQPHAEGPARPDRRPAAIDQALSVTPQLASADADLRRRRAARWTCSRRRTSPPARSSCCRTAPTPAACIAGERRRTRARARPTSRSSPSACARGAFDTQRAARTSPRPAAAATSPPSPSRDLRPHLPRARRAARQRLPRRATARVARPGARGDGRGPRRRRRRRGDEHVQGPGRRDRSCRSRTASGRRRLGIAADGAAVRAAARAWRSAILLVRRAARPGRCASASAGSCRRRTTRQRSSGRRAHRSRARRRRAVAGADEVVGRLQGGRRDRPHRRSTRSGSSSSTALATLVVMYLLAKRDRDRARRALRARDPVGRADVGALQARPAAHAVHRAAARHAAGRRLGHPRRPRARRGAVDGRRGRAGAEPRRVSARRLGRGARRAARGRAARRAAAHGQPRGDADRARRPDPARGRRQHGRGARPHHRVAAPARRAAPDGQGADGSGPAVALGRDGASARPAARHLASSTRTYIAPLFTETLGLVMLAIGAA